MSDGSARHGAVLMAAFWTSDKQVHAYKEKKVSHYELTRRTNKLLPEYQPSMIRLAGEAKLSVRAQLAECRAPGDDRWRVIIIPICMLLFFFPPLFNYGARFRLNCRSRRMCLFFCSADALFLSCCCYYRQICKTCRSYKNTRSASHTS